jgi:hypothetical protein
MTESPDWLEFSLKHRMHSGKAQKVATLGAAPAIGSLQGAG